MSECKYKIEHAARPCYPCAQDRIIALESALAEEKAKSTAEHEMFLTAHRDNLKGSARNVELAKENATLRARVEELETRLSSLAEWTKRQESNEAELGLVKSKLSALLAPVSDSEEREALRWAEDDGASMCDACRAPMRVLARALRQSRAKLAAVEKERDAKQRMVERQMEDEIELYREIAALEADLGRAREAMRRAGEYLGAGQSREAWDRLLVFLDTHPSPAPVAPKPSDSYLVGGDEFFCCKDQDNPCHPINDYCSSGRERVAPTPCCLQVQAGIAPGHSLDCQAPQEGN